MSTTWIPTTEVAKLVRKYLRANFPGQKFSVRSDSYAGGSAVRVETPKEWTQEQTHALWNTLAPWGSAGFDGMTDSSYNKGHHLCPEHGVALTAIGAYWGHDAETVTDTCCAKAEPVHMGASYVQVSRGY
jgi:hypothetical protein